MDCSSNEGDRFDWKPKYDILARKFIKLHFGDHQGITRCFPCMRNEYPWSNHRPSVGDSRVPAKNNTEYHGLETHAMQYHVTYQYEFAFHHWLLAAWWRRGDMKANGFEDSGHLKAIRYAIQQAMYNKSLFNWEKGRRKTLPKPEHFKLTSADIEAKRLKALKQIEDFHERNTTKSESS